MDETYLIKLVKTVSFMDTIDDSQVQRNQRQESITLHDIIDDYVRVRSYPKDIVAGIIVHLLTEGKVSIDFRDYTERLSLEPSASLVDRNKSLAIYDSFCDPTKEAPLPALTQRIILPSKIRRSKP